MIYLELFIILSHLGCIMFEGRG